MSGDLDTLIRLRRWRLDEERRLLAGRLRALHEEEAVLAALEAEIVAEQESARLAADDDIVFAYAAFARVAVARRATATQRIMAAEAELGRQREVVRERWQDVRTLELAEEARLRREVEEAARRERIEIDEIAVLARCRAKRMLKP